MLNVNLLKLVVVAALAVTTTTMTMTTTTVYAQNQTTTTTAAATNATGTNATTTTAATANGNTTTTIISTLNWGPSNLPPEFQAPEFLAEGWAIVDGNRIQQLSPQNIQYQQTDPAFAKLAQVTANCVNESVVISDRIKASGEIATPSTMTTEDIRSMSLCNDVLKEGIAQFCESTDFATFDIQKCGEARMMTDEYLRVAQGAVFG